MRKVPGVRGTYIGNPHWADPRMPQGDIAPDKFKKLILPKITTADAVYIDRFKGIDYLLITVKIKKDTFKVALDLHSDKDIALFKTILKKYKLRRKNKKKEKEENSWNIEWTLEYIMKRELQKQLKNLIPNPYLTTVETCAGFHSDTTTDIYIDPTPNEFHKVLKDNPYGTPLKPGEITWQGRGFVTLDHVYIWPAWISTHDDMLELLIDQKILKKRGQILDYLEYVIDPKTKKIVTLHYLRDVTAKHPLIKKLLTEKSKLFKTKF